MPFFTGPHEFTDPHEICSYEWKDALGNKCQNTRRPPARKLASVAHLSVPHQLRRVFELVYLDYCIRPTGTPFQLPTFAAVVKRDVAFRQLLGLTPGVNMFAQLKAGSLDELDATAYATLLRPVLAYEKAACGMSLVFYSLKLIF